MPWPASIRSILARLMPAQAKNPKAGIDPKITLEELYSPDANTKAVIQERPDRLYEVLYQRLVRETIPDSGEYAYWKEMQAASLTDNLENAFTLAREFLGGDLAGRED